MFSIQEQEELDFNRMGPADEMRWQHAQGMSCSFDCAQCDPYDGDEWEIPSTAARVTIDTTDPWF